MIKRLTVTQTVLGNNLEIVLHEIEGARQGPTLGIIGLVHGDEFATIPMVRQFLERIEPAKLSGRILAIPVASPRALFDFSRYTTELNGNTDLHANFRETRAGR